MGNTVYVGVNTGGVEDMSPVVSQTKRGLAAGIGVSTRTIDRLLKEVKPVEQGWWLLLGPGESKGRKRAWKIWELEVVRSKAKGDVRNFLGTKAGGKLNRE